MTTRLDRLVALLESGATPVVRSTAARQIGGIQKQHPEELFRLLARVYEHIGSKSWDTRVATAQAFEAIAKEVSEWDPEAAADDTKPPVDDDDYELLAFAQFDVDSVIRNGRLLLGSAGREYEDDGLKGLDAQARIAVQRAQIKKRLGLGADFMADELLDDADLDAVMKPAAGRKRKSAEPEDDGGGSSTTTTGEIDMSKLSARERNRLKRKARLDGKKTKKSKVELGPKGGNGSAQEGPVISQTSVEVTEQPGQDSIVVEAKRAEGREALFAISDGTWPFEGLVEALCVDLFDAAWEVRHGAGMALREIFKYHGFGAGRLAGLSAAENQQRNQRFLEDVCVRLMCVFTLDRFGDFVSDHVVAPVRETCAQALGVVSQFLTQPLLVVTQGALLQLIERGTASAIWEARHSGLSGLRYIVAVRRDMASLLAKGTLDAALAGLRDHDDDVRAVSAETLLPLVDTLVTCQPTRIMDVIDGVWVALTDLSDDLAASVASVMDLLARLFSQPSVRAAVIEAGQRDPANHAFAVLIPRLYPFFRHTIASVRRATLQTLLTFASMQAAGAPAGHMAEGIDYAAGTAQHQTLPPWVDTACLRLVLQNMVLETDKGILALTAELWTALLMQCRAQARQQDDQAADGYVLSLLPPEVAQCVFRLAATPIGVPLPRDMLYDPRAGTSNGTSTGGASTSNGGGGSRYNVDAPMIQQDMGLISRDTIMQCRVQAGEALGLLAAAWPAWANVVGDIALSALRSDWALQSQVAGVVVEEFVMAERAQLFAGSGNAAVATLDLMVSEPQFSAPDLVARLAGALADALGGPPRGDRLAYHDMRQSLVRVHGDCALVLAAFGSEGKLAAADVPALSLDTFTIDIAQQTCGPMFDHLLSLVKPRALTAPVKSTLMERRQRLLASIEYHQRLEQQLDVATNAALAGASIAIGRLPPKLNNILRAVMAATKLETSELLQSRAATAISRMAALCYCVEQPPRTGPADKMIKNVATLVCSDPWTTPVFAQRAQQTESMLILEMVQREQAMRELQQQQKSGPSNGASSSAAAAASKSGDAMMAAAATASAQASQRKRRGKGARDEPAVPLVQAAALTEEQEREQAARLVVRGAKNALSATARLFGPQLFETMPRLWAFIAEPLIAAYGPAPEGDLAVSSDVLDAADARFAADPAGAQAVIDALRVLLALAPALGAALRPAYLSGSFGWVIAALRSKFSAVRHIAARAMAELCGVVRVDAMQAFVQTVLPSLGDTTRTHRRQGVAEAVYYIVQRLGEEVLPYVTFLMVPMLGRMSDADEQTRLVCTNCFAQLLKLVPLEADIPDPEGISAELMAKREHERKFLSQLMDSSKLESFRIPIKVNATLRKYQQEGVDWLAFLNKYELHGILCDDMGLGKTLQTICILASDHFLRQQRFDALGAADSQPLPSLVVCPPTLIGHWEQEIRQFTENLQPLCYSGAPAERRALFPRIQTADVVIMSYDVVRNDIEQLAAQSWNYCVLDEGHCIKNGKTKLTQAAKRVRAHRRLILSGTPVQNNVIELWSLFDFLMPGFLGTERQFNELYSKPILASRDAKQMSHAQVSGELALKQLHKQVLPFLLRRMKEDVLQDLPPKIIQDYYCELSPLQRFLYEEFAKSASHLQRSLGMGADGAAEGPAPAAAAAEDEEDGGGEKGGKARSKQATHVFQALQYLRKLCNHPALVLSPKHPLHAQVVADLAARGADLHSLDIAPKMQALKELLNQCGIGTQAPTDDAAGDALLEEEVSASHRVLIFCQHKEMIERIEQDLFQRSMPRVTYMRVDGTVEARRRQEIVTRFNADPSIDCLLLTTHVGGLGLNLTGADTVIFVEHDYNPAMDLQAMDRAHRLGQTRVVNVYRLITRNTLEEKIMGLQAFKLHMANTIVNQQNAGLSSMNTDQLLDLFNVSPPTTTAAKKEPQGADGASRSMSKALEGLEDLWDASQYEEEYSLDGFISSLQQ
ncbi:TATA-binding protein-associated factor mot1 [Coemansia biformis]|uniref:TATA-binding protein-associated factor mot1 n=1 Tax=Coemansia biformis TaxID=1286918 RepID=A0A9W7YEB1_9FUNG|nr:TATA-binding protein-associated factor mot1 [Coemansia biformis]